MGTWFNPTEMHEQWEDYARTVWTHPAQNASNYLDIKNAWDNGYANGHKEIKNGQADT